MFLLPMSTKTDPQLSNVLCESKTKQTIDLTVTYMVKKKPNRVSLLMKKKV